MKFTNTRRFLDFKSISAPFPSILTNSLFPNFKKGRIFRKFKESNAWFLIIFLVRSTIKLRYAVLCPRATNSNSWRSFLRKIQVGSSFSSILSMFLQDWFTNKNLEYYCNTRIPILLNNWFIQYLCCNKSSVHILFLTKHIVTTLLFLVRSVLFVCQSGLVCLKVKVT